MEKKLSTPEKIKSSYQGKKESEFFEIGKPGFGLRFKLSNSKTITWIHRLLTIGVTAYLAGIKEWL